MDMYTVYTPKHPFASLFTAVPEKQRYRENIGNKSQIQNTCLNRLNGREDADGVDIWSTIRTNCCATQWRTAPFSASLCFYSEKQTWSHSCGFGRAAVKYLSVASAPEGRSDACSSRKGRCLFRQDILNPGIVEGGCIDF